MDRYSTLSPSVLSHRLLTSPFRQADHNSHYPLALRRGDCFGVLKCFASEETAWTHRREYTRGNLQNQGQQTHQICRDRYTSYLRQRYLYSSYHKICLFVEAISHQKRSPLRPGEATLVSRARQSEKATSGAAAFGAYLIAVAS